MKRNSFPLFLIAGIASASFLFGQGAGPDVIVGEIDTPDNYGSANGISAFAIGTTSCNIGTTTLSWIANNNLHPVIGQGIYRLHNGRFEQIGMSWLKHGFTALQQNACQPCSANPNGSALGVGCSDPYVAFLNGFQGQLGSKSEVNASTGVFTYPPVLNPPILNLTTTRLQAANSDLNPTNFPGARYFVEGQYVTQDDAAAGNKNNNASHREVTVTTLGSGYAINLLGPTRRTEPAIQAWRNADPSVTIITIDVPNDGRFLIGIKTTDLGGGLKNYEYAVQNLNSHRSAESFSLTFPAGTTISNSGFHDVNYHSTDPYSGTNWTPTIASNGIIWATQSIAQNVNANALRWGTIYNFRCDATQQPTTITLGLFRAGTPATTSVAHPTPPVPSWQTNQAQASLTMNGLTNNAFSSPIQVNLTSGGAASIAFSSTQVGQAWELATTSVPAVARKFVTANNQIVNVDFNHTSFTLLNGGFASTWPIQNFSQPITLPATSFSVTGQFFVVAPSNPDGFAVSAALELSAAPCAGAIQALNLGDDTSVQITLGAAPYCNVNSVTFYGVSYTSCFVNSNGSVTFGSGDTGFTPSVGALLASNPRIAGMWTDLDPSSGGTVTARTPTPGLLNVNWTGVPSYGQSNTNSFGIEFNSNTTSCSLVGFSPATNHGSSTLTGISPGNNGPGLARNFSSYVGIGAQTGGAGTALYQLNGTNSPSGFSRIDFPTANGATFVVQ